MIYIESNYGTYPHEYAFGITINTELSNILEMALGQLLFNHIERKKFVATNDTSCKYMKIGFLGAEIKNGTMSDVDKPGSLSLLNIITEFLINETLTIANEDVWEICEVDGLPLSYTISMDFVYQNGDYINVIVAEE